jgi:8-hydroxy-5-deazaflavin:NADPH oxidoreductase
MVDTVGILGSGPIGQAIARRCVAAGIPVFISNSRGPDSLTELTDALGTEASAVTIQRAAEADLVVLAVPFVKVPEVAAEISNWAGRVVVDATNQFAEYEPSYSGRADLGEETGSEWVARHVYGATVVKAFNALFASFIEPDPRHRNGRQVLFYAGDDAGANDEFHEFGDALGFAPVCVGALRDGGRLLQLDGPLNGLHALKQD